MILLLKFFDETPALPREVSHGSLCRVVPSHLLPIRLIYSPERR
jgi:hypothetical protein